MTNKSYKYFNFSNLVQFDILVKKLISKVLISLKLKKCALSYGCYYDQKGTTLVVSLVFFMRLYDNFFSALHNIVAWVIKFTSERYKIR